jgi:hypothetical protein
MDIEGQNVAPNTAAWRFDTCAAPEPRNQSPLYSVQP